MKSPLVTVSISSLNEEISMLFEKDVPLPEERLQTIQKLSESGIKAGLALMPILPFIAESEFESIIKSARNYNVQYVLHKHLELKGDQKTRYITIIQDHFPELIKKYDELYKDSYIPNTDYILDINKNIEQLCKKYKIKKRIET
jgi:DNA repair photolyase